MHKNIRFSHTVSVNQFHKKLSSLLQQQTDELSLTEKTYLLQQYLENEDYDLFIAHLNRLKESLELYLLFLNDTEDNIKGFLSAGSAKEETQDNIITENEQVQQPVNQAQSANPLQQLEQIEKLVNVVKSLKGDPA